MCFLREICSNSLQKSTYYEIKDVVLFNNQIDHNENGVLRDMTKNNAILFKKLFI